MTLPAEMACRRCRTVLNTYTGPAGHRSHHHPARRAGWDHEPDPVPASTLAFVDRCCDFCSDPFPLYVLRSSPIQAVAAGGTTDYVHNFGDTWSACSICTTLAQTGRTEALVRRAAAILDRGDDLAVAAIRDIQATVVQTLQPGRTLLNTVAWPHTPIAAAILPKVRDRAADLLAGTDHMHLPFDARTRSRITAGLRQAHLYAVDDEFTTLAQHAAASLRRDTVVTDDTFPAPHGLLMWSRPTTTHRITVCSWTTDADTRTVQVTAYRSVGAGITPDALQSLRDHIGWLIPVTTHQIPLHRPGDADEATTVLLTTALLIAQRAAETVPVDVDPSIRKRYARTGRPAPEVRLVRIRGRYPNRSTGTTTSAGPGTTRDPAATADLPAERRWISGFWRQQPYGPGRRLRRDRYVFAYLRGPDGAPIAASTTVRLLAAPPPKPARTAGGDGTDTEPHIV